MVTRSIVFQVVWCLQNQNITETGSARLTSSGGPQSLARAHKIQQSGRLGIREPSGAREKALGPMPDANDNPSSRGQDRDHTAHRVAHLPTHVLVIFESEQNRYQSNARVASTRLRSCDARYVYPAVTAPKRRDQSSVIRLLQARTTAAV